MLKKKILAHFHDSIVENIHLIADRTVTIRKDNIIQNL